MRIVMIGSGYVGLVSGACLSEFGHEVVCVDTDVAKIEGLKIGKVPIYEPGLDEVVAVNAKSGRLSFETDLTKAMAGGVMHLTYHSDDGHTDVDRPSLEIEVTPDMIRAGVEALCQCLKHADEEVACFAAFKAMVEASPILCNLRVGESSE
jgi:UDP-glucose 6-dehydrogenase